MTVKDFTKFGHIRRFSRDVIISEKVDGTNAQVDIDEAFEVLAGSRTRWITPENDNYGFAQWVQDHKDQLIAELGVGRHFGEYWGQGIQRRYGIDEKRFSLFNTGRWSSSDKDHRCAECSCCHVVPVIAVGIMSDDLVRAAMTKLQILGSFAAPGFMNPEGVVIFHTAANVMFKKTFVKDDAGKTFNRLEEKPPQWVSDTQLLFGV